MVGWVIECLAEVSLESASAVWWLAALIAVCAEGAVWPNTEERGPESPA